MLLVAVAKLISVALAGNSASSSFSAKDVDTLRADVAVLNVLNIIEPARAPFAAGALAVLENKLEEADARFSESLSLTDQSESCPARVNLELVRERLGDIDAWEGRPDQARERYHGALAVIGDAPQDCFEGNDDPDPDRRAVRNDAAGRVAAKMAGVVAPPPPAAQPTVAPAPPPPTLAPGVPEPDVSQGPLRLDPTTGDPIDRLRQLLTDAAG
jgi:hypothetical protein